jgi:hypothetical protein
MGEVIDGAMQHAPQAERQSMKKQPQKGAGDAKETSDRFERRPAARVRRAQPDDPLSRGALRFSAFGAFLRQLRLGLRRLPC